MNLRNLVLSAASDAFDRVADAADTVSEWLDAQHDPAIPTARTRPARAAAAQPDAPSTRDRTWESKFAEDLKQGDVIGLDGAHLDLAPGLRALRVTQMKISEHQHAFSNEPTRIIVLLLRDLDSEKAHSIQTGPNAPFEVEVSFDVPDSVPSDAAGLGDGA